MVTMAAPITPPPLRPLPWGLLVDAIDVIPDGARWLAGVTFLTAGCDGPLVLDSDVCGDVDILGDEPERELPVFNPFYAFWNMECSTIGSTYTEMLDVLDGKAKAQLSAVLMAQLANSVNPNNPDLDDGDDVGGGSVVEALAAVEGELARRLYGAQGIIYVPPSIAGTVYGATSVTREGRNLFTATGHLLVVDAGMETDTTISEGFIYGSGPVAAAVGKPVEVGDGASNLDRSVNTMRVQVQAPAVLSFDPCTAVHADYTMA